MCNRSYITESRSFFENMAKVVQLGVMTCDAGLNSTIRHVFYISAIPITKCLVLNTHSIVNTLYFATDGKFITFHYQPFKETPLSKTKRNLNHNFTDKLYSIILSLSISINQIFFYFEAYNSAMMISDRRLMTNFIEMVVIIQTR